MRRLSLLLLLLALLLTGCSSRFTSADGGYLDGKTDRIYMPLPNSFEAISAGEELGIWESELYEDSLTFYKIPNADVNRFLSDENGSVYCADATQPDPGAWTFKSILVCRESAISMAVGNITDAQLIAELLTLWREGESVETPLKELAVYRRLKMVSDDCPGIYYCVSYFIYEDGTAYLYDRDANRTVFVGEALMNSGHIILSALTPEEIMKQMKISQEGERSKSTAGEN